MKPTKRTNASQQSANEVQLARLQLEKAENQLRSAKQQARAAKRRRKEAKLAARRARKQFKLAKRFHAEAKLLLAQAEARLAQSRRRSAAARARTKTLTKPPVTAIKKKSGQTALRTAAKSVKTNKFAAGQTKTGMTLRPAVRTTKHPITVPRDFELPTATASMPSRTEEPSPPTTEMSVAPTPPENQSE